MARAAPRMLATKCRADTAYGIAIARLLSFLCRVATAAVGGGAQPLRILPDAPLSSPLGAGARCPVGLTNVNRLFYIVHFGSLICVRRVRWTWANLKGIPVVQRVAVGRGCPTRGSFRIGSLRFQSSVTSSPPSRDVATGWDLHPHLPHRPPPGASLGGPVADARDGRLMAAGL
jgi:hypothetical protein